MEGSCERDNISSINKYHIAQTVYIGYVFGLVFLTIFRLIQVVYEKEN